jgi:hypothetical protein
MPVTIGEIRSEVTATGAEAGPSAAPVQEREWEQWDRLRSAARRLLADRLRTQSEGFDD